MTNNESLPRRRGWRGYAGRLAPGAAAGVLLSMLCGCSGVETKLQGVVDPDFLGKTHARILVAPMFDDLAIRTAAEAAFVEAMGRTQADAVASLDLLVPTRDWSPDQILEKAAAENCDAVLVIEQTDAFRERQFVPETTTVDRSSYWHGYPGRRFGRWGYGRVDSTATIRRSGGYFVDLPRVRHELRLYDVATKRVCWIATSLTSGDSSMTDEKLLASLARAAVDRLIRDEMVFARAEPRGERKKKENPRDDEARE